MQKLGNFLNLYLACIACDLGTLHFSTSIIPEIELLKDYYGSIQKIQRLSYSGVLEGRVKHTPEGRFRSHNRKLIASSEFRCLEIHHDPEEFIGSYEQSHSVVTMKKDVLEIYYPINRISEISNNYVSLDLNPKLNYTFFEIYIASIGWIPEHSDPIHRKECLNNKWPAWQICHSKTHRFLGSEKIDFDLYLKSEFELEDCRTNVWYSENLGGAPKKIEQHFSKDGISWRVIYTFSEYVAMVDNVFLPKVISREIFTSDNRGNWEKSSYMKLSIFDLLINSEVDLSDFPKEPGTITINFDNGLGSVTRGGMELLDQAVQYAVREIADVRLGKETSSEIVSRVSSIVGGIFGMCLIVGLIHYLRYSRKRLPKAGSN